MSKKQTPGLIVIVLATVLSVSSSCSKTGGGTEWRATIETVDGLKTVRNPGTPRYGEFAFDLAEDLAIGDEKDDAYYFPGGATISVDDDGTIYACDFGNKRVQVYDKSGKYVRTLGRQGQGRENMRSRAMSSSTRPGIPASTVPALSSFSPVRAGS